MIVTVFSVHPLLHLLYLKIQQIAEDDTQDADSKYRALVAIGSLMLNGLVKSIALDLDVKSVANTARASKDSKIAEVGADIELLTR